MAKNLIKKYLPDTEKIKQHPSLKIFGTLLHDNNLWHFNRRSARGAFAVGLFVALIPMPFQMVLAAALAILFRVNLPLSAALVWLTNPLTMGPIFFICYQLGALILGHPGHHVEPQVSLSWLIDSLDTIGKPFLLGSLIVGCTSSALGYVLVDYFWCLSAKKAWKNRIKKRQSQTEPD